MEPTEDPLVTARTWIQQGINIALATVVETWGSAPRPVGSHMVINDRGAFAGSVSGGCIENILVSEALEVIAEGAPQSLSYGVSTEQAQEVRLACGGTIKIFLERLDEPSLLDRLITARPLVRVVDLGSGAWATLDEETAAGLLTLSEGNRSAAMDLLRQDRCGLLPDEERDLMAVSYSKQPRLIVVGAVHIAQALAPIAASIGFETIVVDPRPAFARADRLPGVAVRTDRPEAALKDLDLDDRTAVVALAHDPMLDDPTLKGALDSQAFYIGCLGSRKTHAKRRQRLQNAGFDEAALDRLHGPIGLDIGARSPEEIAISILAEVIAARRGKDPRR
ncbi:XdhC family protein [Magnetospira sp. QH-2]|uniref:XdhC family protein n=1 Tax=Magnetospira sp. (strain QH-2) TaxID=1288970 RepID=UPI0003E810AC|nr:XdhC family protein [Magnetospira sp. QH-2]CCQ75116.1 conserved protein of unknown function(similar to XdhC/CoxF family protein) [Magnetospira sp. QH-2]